MIEKIILDHLNANLDVPVMMEYPAKPPEAFVVIEKTAGGEENHIMSSMFAIQSIHKTLFKAAELNESVKAAMKNLVIHDEVSSCSLNTDYNFTDPETKRYRYQAVYDITHF